MKQQESLHDLFISLADEIEVRMKVIKTITTELLILNVETAKLRQVQRIVTALPLF